MEFAKRLLTVGRVDSLDGAVGREVTAVAETVTALQVALVRKHSAKRDSSRVTFWRSVIAYRTVRTSYVPCEMTASRAGLASR